MTTDAKDKSKSKENYFTDEKIMQILSEGEKTSPYSTYNLIETDEDEKNDEALIHGDIYKSDFIAGKSPIYDFSIAN